MERVASSASRAELEASGLYIQNSLPNQIGSVQALTITAILAYPIESWLSTPVDSPIYVLHESHA